MIQPVETWRDASTRTQHIEQMTMLMSFLEARLPYLHGSSVRVGAACKLMAAAMDLTKEEQYALSLVARFHDIGLLAIPDELLLRHTRLTPKDQARVDEHAELGGHYIAKAFPDFPEVVEGVWLHHERPDGNGPFRLRTDEIPLIASIVAVVSSVDAMAHDRPHHKAMAWRQIVDEIQLHTDTQFSRRAVAAFALLSDNIRSAITGGGTNGRAGRTAGSWSAANDDKCILSHGSDTSQRSTGDKLLCDLSPVLTKETLLNLVQGGLELRPLAPVVANVLAVTQSPHCSADDMAKEISLDHALSMRIMKLANSAAYRRGKRTDNVKMAIARIGVHTVRKLVMTLDILNQYEGLSAQHVDVRLFWEHSIGTGLIASMIGNACRPEASEEYFLSGIVHDVGRLILLDHVPDQYSNVLQAADTYDLPVEEVEVKLTGLTHCEILQRALEHWRFSSEFTLPVTSHHYSVSRIERMEPAHRTNVAIIALADRIAHALLLGSSGNNTIYPLDDLIEVLGLKGHMLDQIVAAAPDEASKLKISMLARSSTDIWPDQVSQVKERLSAPIRPLCVSMEPGADAYRMFCERISDGQGDGPVNLGIIYIRDAGEQAILAKKYEAQKQEVGIERLPTVLILDTGHVTADEAWSDSEPYVVLNTPVSIATFLKAIDDVQC